MKLVIDIPKKDYDKMCKGELIDTIVVAIKNGIVLPKRHGDLKDADELLIMTENYKSELGRLKADPFVKCGIETVENFIKEIPTIIEADKAKSEDKE